MILFLKSKMKRLEKIIEINNRLGSYLEKHPIRTLAITSFVAFGMLFYALLGNAKVPREYNNTVTKLIKTADINKDGTLSLQEQAELWRRLSYETPFVEGINLTEKLQSYHDTIEFHYDKIPRVTKAIKSYEGEN